MAVRAFHTNMMSKFFGWIKILLIIQHLLNYWNHTLQYPVALFFFSNKFEQYQINNSQKPLSIDDKTIALCATDVTFDLRVKLGKKYIP